jgi:cellulose synthase/poly-beta-1,6-N-acetylglucosamine synthase-like glycosyltransferase
MFIVSKVYRKKFVREPITPTVSLVIAAYNEEKAIAGKIENSLAIDYPKDKLEIIVASDSSTDRTDEIVRSFADRGVKLVRTEGNLGKSPTLNQAAKQATGEILAFSDATGHWSKDSIRSMAQHYADPRVGCVSGWVDYSYDKSTTAQGFGIYQQFVMALRRAEASFGTGFNAPGSIHSIRKSAYKPLPAATFGDMVDPFHAAVQGLNTTFENNAVSLEESRTKTIDEWQARTRICLRAWDFMFYALLRFPIFRSPMYCLQLISHKFLRWLVGPFMVPIFIINAVLFNTHWIYQVLFACQIAYYGLTLIGYLFSKFKIRVRGISGLLFYNEVNLAYLVTLVKYLFGTRCPRWKPLR